MTKTILLFVVRHGEREDEAIRREYSAKYGCPKKEKHKRSAFASKKLPPLPPHDAVDPLLTRSGHQQAHDAFASLLPVLGGQKVAMFCSPLRRAVGTALMAGASSHRGSKIDWSVPPSRGSVNSNTDSIHVTVLNELGDFAAAVHRRGGVSTLISSRPEIIPCADRCDNDGTPGSPFVRAYYGMQTHAVTSRPSAGKPVCFWRIGRDGYARPMSPPLSLESKPFEKTATAVVKYPKAIAPTAANPVCDPMESLDFAVRLTAARGCAVCIVAAHRETIYAAADESHFFGQMRPPYCSIGSFVVTLNDGESGREMLSYQFHGVSTLGGFGRGSIPKALPSVQQHGERSTVVLATKNRLVPVGSILSSSPQLQEGYLGPRIVLRYNRSKLSTGNNLFEFHVEEGMEHWGHIMRELRKHLVVLVGSAIWVLPNSQSRRLRIQIDVSEQCFQPSPAPLRIALFLD